MPRSLYTIGSAGGSLLYSFHDAVYGFTLIDGTGTKHILSRDDPDPTLFLAAGVSAGLCGIITDVTLTLTPAFKVTGTQQTSPIQPLNPDWKLGCPVNLYGPATQGVPGVEEYFKDPNNEYMRMVSNLNDSSINLDPDESLHSSIGPNRTFHLVSRSGLGNAPFWARRTYPTRN